MVLKILVELDSTATKTVPQTEQTFTYSQRGQKVLLISCPEALLTQRELKLDSQLLLNSDCVITPTMLSIIRLSDTLTFEETKQVIYTYSSTMNC